MKSSWLIGLGQVRTFSTLGELAVVRLVMAGLLLSLSTVFIHGASASDVENGALSLDSMIDSSAIIVVARVDTIVKVGLDYVAHATVIEKWKGNANSSLTFEALPPTGRFGGDRLGETVLLFLVPNPNRMLTAERQSTNPAQFKVFNRTLGAIPLSRSAGFSFVDFFPDQLPANLRHFEPQDSTRAMGSTITLDALRSYVTESRYTDTSDQVAAGLTRIHNLISSPRALIFQPRRFLPFDAPPQASGAAVYFVITVQPTGRVRFAKVAVSSGFPNVDNHAERNVRRWIFEPSTQVDSRLAIVSFNDEREDTPISSVFFEIPGHLQGYSLEISTESRFATLGDSVDIEIRWSNRRGESSPSIGFGCPRIAVSFAIVTPLGETLVASADPVRDSGGIVIVPDQFPRLPLIGSGETVRQSFRVSNLMFGRPPWLITFGDCFESESYKPPTASRPFLTPGTYQIWSAARIEYSLSPDSAALLGIARHDTFYLSQGTVVSQPVFITISAATTDDDSAAPRVGVDRPGPYPDRSHVSSDTFSTQQHYAALAERVTIGMTRQKVERLLNTSLASYAEQGGGFVAWYRLDRDWMMTVSYSYQDTNESTGPNAKVTGKAQLRQNILNAVNIDLSVPAP